MTDTGSGRVAGVAFVLMVALEGCTWPRPDPGPCPYGPITQVDATLEVGAGLPARSSNWGLPRVREGDLHYDGVEVRFTYATASGEFEAVFRRQTAGW